MGFTCGKIHLVFPTVPNWHVLCSPKVRPQLSVANNGYGASEETGVGRYKKIGGSLEESARGAQRGLLVIVVSALVWIAAIWIGYRFFT